MLGGWNHFLAIFRPADVLGGATVEVLDQRHFQLLFAAEPVGETRQSKQRDAASVALSRTIEPLRGEIIQLMNKLVEKSCPGAGGKRIKKKKTQQNESIGMQSDSRLTRH